MSFQAQLGGRGGWGPGLLLSYRYIVFYNVHAFSGCYEDVGLLVYHCKKGLLGRLLALRSSGEYFPGDQLSCSQLVLETIGGSSSRLWGGQVISIMYAL